MSRRRAALFVVLGYISIVAFAALVFATLEQVQPYNDYRNIQATEIFAAVMAVPFGAALFMLSRRTKPPPRPWCETNQPPERRAPGAVVGTSYRSPPGEQSDPCRRRTDGCRRLAGTLEDFP